MSIFLIISIFIIVLIGGIFWICIGLSKVADDMMDQVINPEDHPKHKHK